MHKLLIVLFNFSYFIVVLIEGEWLLTPRCQEAEPKAIFAKYNIILKFYILFYILVQILGSASLYLHFLSTKVIWPQIL